MILTMCRLLGYLGAPIQLDSLLDKPEHSLIVQSYQPQEMTSGVVNADGFGIGWYRPQSEENPFIYKNILPIWSDINLPYLSRYIKSSCILANVRSATVGQAVDLSNCHPFSNQKILFTHNGFIENFRQSLYRPICDRLSDPVYNSIKGSTDSEHIFGLFLENLQNFPSLPLEQILQKTLSNLIELAQPDQVAISANIILSDGHHLIASRFAVNTQPPSLYWIKNPLQFPQGVIIASEALFSGTWNQFTENSILAIGENLEYNIYPIR